MHVQDPQKSTLQMPARRLVLALAAIVVGLVGIEMTLQAAVAIGWPKRLADPEAYAHPLCDSWYWRTQRQRSESSLSTATHPGFGWLPIGEGRDQDGVWTPSTETAGAPVVLVGDSFLAGTT